MILGFRDLTPELRAQQNLTFDVMPMPRVSSSATIARCRACASPRRPSTPTRRPTSSPTLISDEDAAAAGRDRLRDAVQRRRRSTATTSCRPASGRCTPTCSPGSCAAPSCCPATRRGRRSQRGHGACADPALLRPGDPAAAGPPRRRSTQASVAALRPAEGAVAVGHPPSSHVPERSGSVGLRRLLRVQDRLGDHRRGDLDLPRAARPDERAPRRPRPPCRPVVTGGFHSTRRR